MLLFVTMCRAPFWWLCTAKSLIMLIISFWHLLKTDRLASGRVRVLQTLLKVIKPGEVTMAGCLIQGFFHQMVARNQGRVGLAHVFPGPFHPSGLPGDMTLPVAVPLLKFRLPVDRFIRKMVDGKRKKRVGVVCPVAVHPLQQFIYLPAHLQDALVLAGLTQFFRHHTIPAVGEALCRCFQHIMCHLGGLFTVV